MATDPKSQMPELSTGDPRTAWDNYFRQHRPAPQVVSDWVSTLHQQGQYAQVIACLQGALLHGQSQPWMYEVLALSMELENYPKESVERVVLSLTDFGQVNYENMMFSGAYLSRFGRSAAALRMYRQSSRMLPERPEPYLLGLKLAKESGNRDDIVWAATGILATCWEPGQQKDRRDAENALLEVIRAARREGNSAEAGSMEQKMAAASAADVEVRVEWHGDADLDLYVEEPDGSICSCEQPLTSGGGIYLKDGLGPDPAQAYEHYVCPVGNSGPYRIIVKATVGKPVADRAVVTVTLHGRTPEQKRIVRTLTLEGGEAAFTVDLSDGRRRAPRLISKIESEAPPARQRVDLHPRSKRREGLSEDDRQAIAEFQQRMQRSPGAVGYAPTVITLLDGTTMTGQAVISADRRYVRLSLQPQISTITDVFQFSFLNGIPASGR